MARGMVRQGDVLLIPITREQRKAMNTSTAPANRTREDGVVLAFGEVTGHAHVAKGPGVELSVQTRTELIDPDRRWMGRQNVTTEVLDVKNATEIVHEEHETLPLAPGAWEVRHQREYDPQASTPQRTTWVRD